MKHDLHRLDDESLGATSSWYGFTQGARDFFRQEEEKEISAVEAECKRLDLEFRRRMVPWDSI